MPKRNDDSKNTETIRIRLTPELKALCNTARLAGAHNRMAESAFIAYLIEIGLRKYETAILPLELGKDISSLREPDNSPLILPSKKACRKKPPGK